MPAATREYNHTTHTIFTYRTLTYSGGPSQTTSADSAHFSAGDRQITNSRIPQHRMRNPCRVSHTHGLAIIRVRSPLLTESLTLFSSPAGTEMFHFPASTSTAAMYSLRGDHPSRRPGFPIRTSSDQRLVGSSPRHNAASHVLHRLSMPRHPPCALHTQHTQPTTEQAVDW